jgi:hypothetical protein
MSSLAAILLWAAHELDADVNGPWRVICIEGATGNSGVQASSAIFGVRHCCSNFYALKKVKLSYRFETVGIGCGQMATGECSSKLPIFKSAASVKLFSFSLVDAEEGLCTSSTCCDIISLS